VNVIRAQADIQIEQRPDRVYEFITDGFERNYPRWVGSLARQVRVDQGRRSESTFKITHMHPDQRLTFQGTTFPFLVDFRLDPADEHTKLSFTFELRRVDLFMRPFEKLIRVAVQDGAERTVRNLKRLIETETAAP
jgi:carbon monoxide dehydrogenase subunit G